MDARWSDGVKPAGHFAGNPVIRPDTSKARESYLTAVSMARQNQLDPPGRQAECRGRIMGEKDCRENLASVKEGESNLSAPGYVLVHTGNLQPRAAMFDRDGSVVQEDDGRPTFFCQPGIVVIAEDGVDWATSYNRLQEPPR